MRFKMAHGFMVIVLLLMQLQSLVGLRSVAAAENLPSTVAAQIIQTDELDVEVNGTRTGDQIQWRVAFNKKQMTPAAALQIRTSTSRDIKDALTPQENNHFQEVQAADEGSSRWWIEKEASAQSNGSLIYTTNKSQNKLYVAVAKQTHEKGKTATDIITNTQGEAIAEVVLPVEAASSEEEQEADPDPANQNGSQEQKAEETSVVQKQEDLIQRFRFTEPLHARAGSSTAEEVFAYTDPNVVLDGIYPKHGTSDYASGKNSEFVKNYNYREEKTEGNTWISWINNDNQANFNDGYHTYTDRDQLVGYTKKTVTPTDDPTQFKVQLDMIGAQIATTYPVDIVLVLDRSSSMNGGDNAPKPTPWDMLVNAVKDFSDTMLNNNTQVQMGMVGFGSFDSKGNQNNNDNVPFAEIANFGDGDTAVEFNGFTKTADDIKNQTMMTQTALTWSGTPTFLGFDAGMRLLTNPDMGAREGANKILITITDGQPTFAPKDKYHVANGQGISVEKSLENTIQTYSADNLSLELKSDYWDGNGTGVVTNSDSTHRKFLEKRFGDNLGVKGYSIGYINDNNVSGYLGPDGRYAANDHKSVLAALEGITAGYTKTIVRADVFDPMSDYVDLDQDTLKTFKLNLLDGKITASDYENDAAMTVTSTNDSISMKDVTLGKAENGGNEGYRITYNVTLKEDYRDGKFYPANETTFLKNNAGAIPDYLHFAVPSVRTESKKIEIKVVKHWEDQEDYWKTREGLMMTVQRRAADSTDDKDWQDFEQRRYTGELTFSVPEVIDGKMQAYRVVETTENGGKKQVPGYYMPEYKSENTADGKKFTVTNVLKEAEYEFTKYAEDKKTPMKGIEFTATHTNGKPKTVTSNDQGVVKFEGLPAGVYEVTETTPNGFKKKNPFTLTVTDPGNEDQLTVKSDLKDNEFNNELKPFTLDLFKKDAHDSSKNVEGAEFLLTGPGISEPLTTDANGHIVFKSKLVAGKYTLKETDAPTGYLQLKGDFTFEIKVDGTVVDFKYNGTDLKQDDSKLTSQLNDGEKNNTISITTKNTPDDKEVLPQTGGPGNWMYLLLASVLMTTALGYALWINNRTKEV